MEKVTRIKTSKYYKINGAIHKAKYGVHRYSKDGGWYSSVLGEWFLDSVYGGPLNALQAANDTKKTVLGFFNTRLEQGISITKDKSRGFIFYKFRIQFNNRCKTVYIAAENCLTVDLYKAKLDKARLLLTQMREEYAV